MVEILCKVSDVDAMQGSKCFSKAYAEKKLNLIKHDKDKPDWSYLFLSESPVKIAAYLGQEPTV